MMRMGEEESDSKKVKVEPKDDMEEGEDGIDGGV